MSALLSAVIHIDLDEEPTELVDDQTKSEVEDVVVVETEPQPPKPEEAKPALPPEPVPAPPEPAVEPSAVEVSKPLAPSDLGMLPQPVMPGIYFVSPTSPLSLFEIFSFGIIISLTVWIHKLKAIFNPCRYYICL